MSEICYLTIVHVSPLPMTSQFYCCLDLTSSYKTYILVNSGGIDIFSWQNRVSFFEFLGVVPSSWPQSHYIFSACSLLLVSPGKALGNWFRNHTCRKDWYLNNHMYWCNSSVADLVMVIFSLTSSSSSGCCKNCTVSHLHVHYICPNIVYTKTVIL